MIDPQPALGVAAAIPPEVPRVEPLSPLLPLMCAVLAATCFVGMDATVKVMASRYDALHLGFFRFAGGCAFAIPLWLWKRSPLPIGAAWRLHVARSLALLISLLGYFYALTELPLVLAVTISYLAPVFVAVLAVPVLHERPSKSIWLALATALTGVAISVWPEWSNGIGTFSLDRLLGMASAAGAALAFAIVFAARTPTGTARQPLDHPAGAERAADAVVEWAGDLALAAGRPG